MKWFKPDGYHAAYPEHPRVEGVGIRSGVTVPLLGVLHITGDTMPYVKETRAQYRRYHDLFLLFGAWEVRLYLRPLFRWKTVDVRTHRAVPGTIRVSDEELAIDLQATFFDSHPLPEEFSPGELRTARLSRRELGRRLVTAFEREALECPQEIRLIREAQRRKTTSILL